MTRRPLAGALLLLALDVVLFVGFAADSRWGCAAVAGLTAVLVALAVATDLVLAAVDRRAPATGRYTGTDR